MSLISRRRIGHTFDELSVKLRLNDALKVLDSNCKVLGNLTEDISDVEDILARENEMILEEVDKKVQMIRQALNEYVENIQTDLKSRFDRNVKCLREFETKLNQELTNCVEDTKKCENTLRDLDKDCKNVNKTKVMELVLNSINTQKIAPPLCELDRTIYHDTGDDNQLNQVVPTLVGKLSSRQESLQEIKHPAVLVNTIKIEDKEVNAMVLTAEKNNPTNVWINQGVSTELKHYTNSGELVNTVNTDFKVNDMDANADGKILATSTDCYRLRCIRPMKNGTSMQIYSITDKLYLHSLTVSQDGETIVACGTDAPNYTNQAPNEVVIIEYSPPGRELKRIAISGYTGKVYRFVQNGDNNYVLTFPKDGMILAVNGLNGEITASFDSSDFLRCLSKHIKPADDAVFWPSGLCCNSRRHIFVTEWVNKLLLMLDKDCQFLRCIGSNHLCPNAVCYNERSETLWLGDRGKIKVWNMKQLK